MTIQSSSKPFFVIWFGQAFSLLGSQVVQFAVVWWLTRTTGSATVLALASLVALLPQIIIGPFAGVLVDRWSRKKVMICADSASAVATLVLAWLFYIDAASVSLIYLLLMIRSTCGAFHWPAMHASTTLMIPQENLSKIAGLNQTLGGAATILIPPLGALMVEAFPMQAVLAIDVATAVPAILSLAIIPIPQPARSEQPLSGSRSVVRSFFAEMREGLRFVLGWRGLMLLMLVGVLINMLGRAGAALLPLLVMDHFQAGALGFAAVQSADGIGVVIGGITLGIWGGFRRKVVTQLTAILIDGLLFIAVALMPQTAFLPVVAVFFCAGFLESIAIGVGGALGQILIPPEMQGRLFALSISVTQALAPLGLLIAGPVTETFGVPFWYLLTGCLFAAIGIGGLLIPELLNVENPAYRPKNLIVQ